ncbi:MAG TPA: cytochrome c [Candidatus Acidoferrales bacterium]|nr:cytochrome c [Candidatus Acidoferrales bacterium]
MRKEIAAFSALALFGVSGAPRHVEQSAQQTVKPSQPAGQAAAQTKQTAAQTEKTAAASAASAAVMPANAAKLANPVKPTAASIAAGKQMYGYDCAMCHGANGSGKGDLAADMKLTLKDYREPASLKDMTDGEMFYIIQKGKGDMTGEGNRQKPDGIWNMINYLRSLSKKTQAHAK